MIVFWNAINTNESLEKSWKHHRCESAEEQLRIQYDDERRDMMEQERQGRRDARDEETT